MVMFSRSTSVWLGVATGALLKRLGFQPYDALTPSGPCLRWTLEAAYGRPEPIPTTNAVVRSGSGCHWTPGRMVCRCEKSVVAVERNRGGTPPRAKKGPRGCGKF